MDRLTNRTQEGIAYLVNVKDNEQEVECKSRNTAQCILDSWERLATYEDAEEQGRLVVLPCKVGDTVYLPTEVAGLFGGIMPFTMKNVCLSLFGNFGCCTQEITITLEEAEAALRKENDDGTD